MFFLAGSRATVKETIMKDLSNDLVISNNMLRLLDCVGQGRSINPITMNSKLGCDDFRCNVVYSVMS